MPVLSEADAVLAELESRAGASDSDRSAWLAARRRGVTATEVRDLTIKGLGFRRDLIAQKLSGQDMEDLSHVRVIGWGHEREAAVGQTLGAAYGLRPESRIFHAADNDRFLASPDFTGVTFDSELRVGELKTSGKDISLGTDAFERTGYLLQMTWLMRVTGARRCLFAWEERIEVDGRFEPGQMTVAWVDYDEELAQRLEVVATEFLAELDAAGEDGPAVIDEELDTLAVNYLRGLEAEKEGKALKESSYRAIVERIDAGEPVLQESALARVSWSPETVEQRPVFEVDADAARAAKPQLYARLEQAEDDAAQAAAALAVEKQMVLAHEEHFRKQTGVEPVVTKRSALRVTAAKGTKA